MLWGLTQQCQQCNKASQWYQLCRKVWFSKVNYTMEADSVISIITLSLTQQCQLRREVWLSSVNYVVESDSAVSTSLWSLTQQCQLHCKVWLSSVNYAAKSDSAVSIRALCLSCYSNFLLDVAAHVHAHAPEFAWAGTVLKNIHIVYFRKHSRGIYI